MNILEFFNPNDIEHIKAMAYFQDNGKFPEDFLPKDIELPPPPGWYWRLYVKLGNRWIKHQLASVPNMSPLPSGEPIRADSSEVRATIL